ncbi:putative reverse transcriptase domain-containing protein [Tanacetum coccineum]
MGMLIEEGYNGFWRCDKTQNDENISGTTANIADANVTALPTSPSPSGPTPAGNTLGMSSYANVNSELSRKALNFRTLFTPPGNGVDVVVPMESIRAIRTLGNPNVNVLKEDVGNVLVWVKLHGVPMTSFSEDGLSVIATKLALIDVQADVELKDNIMLAMPKLVGERFYTCTVRVEYEWKPSWCVCCKVFGRVQDECTKNIDSDVVKNMKKPSQAPRGVPVGPNVGFKPVKQVYRHVSKMNNVNTCGNKKKDAGPTIEVSNSNSFDVLNSVKNDVDLCTNGETSNLASKKANSSISSSWNVESSSTSTTPIVEKIDKIKRLIIDGKVTLVDDECKPLAKVDSSGDHDSEDEVASVDNEMKNFLASKKLAMTLIVSWKNGRKLMRMMTMTSAHTMMIWRNNNHRKKTTTDTRTSTSGSDGILNDATPCVDAAVKVVSPSVVEETVAMECHVVITPGVGPNPPPPKQEANAPTGNAPGKPSYATATGKPSGKKVNVRTLFTPGGNGIDVVVLVDSVSAISERFANTTYGFFLGKKVAYPVVANYVRNTWGKYELVRLMFSSSTGLFSFQFSSIDGLDAMLENGPWFIRNNLLILKKWHPDENLLKEDVSTVPVWVKLYGVPVTTFSEDGLSAIATKLGTPLMLDSYKSDMCMQYWGRSSYARVMIELRADVELKDNIVVAMPKITREGHYTCNVHVEYEWKPLRCSSCKVFGHIQEEFLKNTGVGEKKTVKKPSLTSRGVSVGPKVVKRRKVWNLLLRLLDNDGNPLVPTGIVESDSEVEVDSYSDNDDYDPYDDDMYENHDLFEHLQSICDDLDITVRGRKKK